jgi:hypothetical protein
MTGMRVRFGLSATPVASSDPSDLPPLTAEVLEHLRWLVETPCAIPQLDKPTLARLLDDRARLIEAVHTLLLCHAIGEQWREPAECLLIRVEG